MANIPGSQRNGASLLANSFGVGFIDWLDGSSSMHVILSMTLQLISSNKHSRKCSKPVLELSDHRCVH